VYKKTGHKIPTQEEHPIAYNILSVILFSINYNTTDKSQLKYQIKYDFYKISPKKLKKKL